MNLEERIIVLQARGYIDADNRMIWAYPDPTDYWPPVAPAPCFINNGCDWLSTMVAAIIQYNDPTQIDLPEDHGYSFELWQGDHAW